MEQICFRDWDLLADIEATRRAYSSIAAGAPDLCGCEPCRKFALARPWAYPAEMLALLDQVGVDSSKEVEVHETGQVVGGLHRYEGWFHFLGRSKSPQQQADVVLRSAPHFSMFIHDKAVLVRECFKSQPVVQIDFEVDVQWVRQAPP